MPPQTLHVNEATTQKMLQLRIYVQKQHQNSTKGQTAKILQPPRYFKETTMNLNEENSTAVNQSTAVQMSVAVVEAISQVQ